LEKVRWLRTIGCRWDERVIDAFASKGELEHVQWARKHGCPWGKNICRAALSGLACSERSLDVLKWLRANGREYTGWEMVHPFELGRLDVLQWQSADGCPWEVGRHCAALDSKGRCGTDSSPLWSGRERLRVVTSTCCSGRTQMAALGISSRTRPQRIATTTSAMIPSCGSASSMAVLKHMCEGGFRVHTARCDREKSRKLAARLPAPLAPVDPCGGNESRNPSPPNI
jgi:hypothetical protein